MKNYKKDFPIFSSHPNLVYLDSAATSQKPQVVIDAVTKFYTNYTSNVHRGLYSLSEQATNMYEASRKHIAEFIGCLDAQEIIFTGNATEAINLVAVGYAKKFLKSGDIVVLSDMEHHSNIVPWQRLRDTLGIKLFYIPLTPDFKLDYRFLSTLPVNKIKLISLTHVSNVLGVINQINQIQTFLKKTGCKAKLLIDAAQSIPHIPIDVKSMGCDFLVFSSHKMLGPSGVGVLWAKKKLLETMDPLFVGSHMISSVTKDTAVWADLPDKFEAGTGRLEGVVGLGVAVKYLNKIGMNNIFRYEQQLGAYALEQFLKIPGLILYGPHAPAYRLNVYSFNLGKIHPHDVGEILNRHQICVRTGHHCAQPLLAKLNTTSTVRASLYFYNTPKDIDMLAAGLTEVTQIFKHV